MARDIEPRNVGLASVLARCLFQDALDALQRRLTWDRFTSLEARYDGLPRPGAIRDLALRKLCAEAARTHAQAESAIDSIRVRRHRIRMNDMAIDTP